MYNINIKKSKKNQKGITLVALIITIVILLIIAGIGIYSGTNSLNKANLEGLKTNMLLIKAKSREYVEEANFKIGKETEETKINEIKKEVYETNGKLIKATQDELTKIGLDSNTECYEITGDALQLWGLDKIELDEEKNEKYLLEFNEENISVEVYNTKGYNGKYSLTDLEI